MTEKKRKTNQRCGSPLHLYACVLVRCALLLVIIGRISESEREEKVLIPLLLHNVFPGEAIIIRWAGELSITHPSSAARSFLFFPCLILIFSPLFLPIWKALINELLPALSLLVYQASSALFDYFRKGISIHSVFGKDFFLSPRKYGGKWKFNHEIPYSISALRNRALTEGFKYR